MNTFSKQIASQFRQLFFGGNWTSVDFSGTLKDADMSMATKKIEGFNTIALLVYHVNYYIDAVMKVLNGGPLDAHDKFSFDCPDIKTEEDWINMRSKLFKDAEAFAVLIEQLSDNNLAEVFCLEKYGNYYRNLTGIIEHSHYHLGQIVLIKKMVESIPTTVKKVG